MIVLPAPCSLCPYHQSLTAVWRQRHQLVQTLGPTTEVISYEESNTQFWWFGLGFFFVWLGFSPFLFS